MRKLRALALLGVIGLSAVVSGCAADGSAHTGTFLDDVFKKKEQAPMANVVADQQPTALAATTAAPQPEAPKFNVAELEAKMAKGDMNAAYMLGNMYRTGSGVEQNEATAFKYYKKAADKNHVEAAYETGFAYTLGRGVRKDERTALHYFYVAAINGKAPAAFEIGFSYETGRGVAKNLDKAKAWYQKAAEGGEQRAAAQLANLK